MEEINAQNDVEEHEKSEELEGTFDKFDII